MSKCLNEQVDEILYEMDQLLYGGECWMDGLEKIDAILKGFRLRFEAQSPEWRERVGVSLAIAYLTMARPKQKFLGEYVMLYGAIFEFWVATKGEKEAKHLLYGLNGGPDGLVRR